MKTTQDKIAEYEIKRATARNLGEEILVKTFTEEIERLKEPKPCDHVGTKRYLSALYTEICENCGRDVHGSRGYLLD
jgi:hypothetical protein